MGPQKDRGATSQKTMQYVKNRNNINRLNFTRRMEFLERENTMNITTIDQNRLDMWDFMRQLRRCASDELPESKHWLGSKTQRVAIDTAPEARNACSAISGAADDHGTGSVDTVATPVDQKTKGEKTTMKQDGDIKSQNDSENQKAEAAAKSCDKDHLAVIPMVDIPTSARVESRRFAQKLNPRRAVLTVKLTTGSRLAPPIGVLANRSPIDSATARQEGRQSSSDVNDNTSSEERQERLRAWREKVARDKLASQTARDKAAREHMNGSGNLMRHLLIENAKRYRRRKKRPIDERFRDFYRKVNELKLPDDSSDERDLW